MRVSLLVDLICDYLGVFYAKEGVWGFVFNEARTGSKLTHRMEGA